MSIEDYEKAHKLGKREYWNCILKGERPTPPVLDDILPPRGSYSEVSLGIEEVAIDDIIGTKTDARSNAFARNFMPMLEKETEFGQKWAALSTSHVVEGLHTPPKLYEYMNKYYVEEGNKRISVLKFFEAKSIQADVIRIIPKRTEEVENKRYYEFLEFYKQTKINYIQFTKEGSYKELLALLGKEEGDVWTENERIDFQSTYKRFKQEYEKKQHNSSVKPSDAFLSFIKVHGYQQTCEMSIFEMKELMEQSWEEFELLEQEEHIDLKLDPNEKKSLFGKLYSIGMPKLKIAFLYEKTPSSSAWTYGHELGRLHLENIFSEEVSTTYYDNVTQENIELYLDKAIAEGCNLIFTTTPTFTTASVKAAIAHPSIRIVNCSVNTSHRYIRTYYARTHEAKFLMGAIAGAMAENDKIVYIADYPIVGTIANINAFALGAKLVNPRAQIHLEWSCIKNHDISKQIEQIQPSCISAKDMMMPEEKNPYFGIYHMEDGTAKSLATPLLHWGKFYEQLIRAIMDGTWKYDDGAEHKAINYWWGMSAEVIDVACSRNLPIGTKRLIEFLKKNIMSGEFNPFTGILYSQSGIVQNDPERSLTPEEIVAMDWLAENVIGTIPTKEELVDSAIPLFAQQGIEKKG